ncbi:MAG: hypothetical protein GQ540_03430 [Lutibacter sp.]|uniref:hypothetical protein n=1 Tax=Lutibacter sp. TaxID=1925666 RepID=UPI001A0FAE02|nr:hypothetical protein [Lutibacter sp.]NOR27564.1 hypothetical protein [Lutibacter sp.]
MEYKNECIYYKGCKIPRAKIDIDKPNMKLTVWLVNDYGISSCSNEEQRIRKVLQNKFKSFSITWKR